MPLLARPTICVGPCRRNFRKTDFGQTAVREARLSDPRLQVSAALIERAGISLCESRRQAAELQRVVGATGYGPVSPDPCERMVKAIKERMPDWG